MIRLTNRLFDSHPIVAHCPGALPGHWHAFVTAVLSSEARPSPCRDLTIITWQGASSREKPLGVLEQTLARFSTAPLVLTGGSGEWRNVQKLRMTAAALEDVSTPFVAGLDSSDVVVVDDPGLLVDRFRSHFTASLVFNATGPPCWPLLPDFVEFESTRPMAPLARGRHWLNAGAWIGETEFCRRFFRQLAAEPPVPGYESSEQAVIKRAWPRWYPHVQLDYSATLFQWFKEDPAVFQVERAPVPRQTQLLSVLQKLPRCRCGAEVGVYEGDTADFLLRSLPDLRLWLVDPWEPYPGHDSFAGRDRDFFHRARRRALWWTEHARDRRFVLEEPSPAAASRFSRECLDFVFIDANHSYESVRADVQAWWPAIRSGGVLCGHDYGVYGDADGRWGVKRAVDEFAALADRTVDSGADGVWWILR